MQAMIKRLCAFFVVGLILMIPHSSVAQSDWEFYFFGVNTIDIAKGDLTIMAIGAVASLFTHELGHVLYLESQGKDWELQTSSAGLYVYSDNFFTDNQKTKGGRAGFALQLGISAVLLSVDRIKDTDFTRGWVGMNAFQLSTASLRGNDDMDRGD